MQKATPLVLVLILAITAGFLSLRETPAKPAAAERKAAPIPPAGQPAATEKTDTSRTAVEPRAWPQQKSDIAADPQANFGTLANGMRYVIYPNSEPPKRVSLRLHIDAGSLMETDPQQGLAHFLEHMAFNGTKHYSAADLIPKMQRLGIAFGAHANAYTSFDETVYMLDLPDLSEDTLDLAFTVMRDFSDGAKLELGEIDKERGVVLSEKISRDSVQYRIMRQQFNALLPGSLVSKRFPIGEEAVIAAAPREEFVDFYTRWYTPERMTFVVIGDVDPAAMKQRIEAAFGSMGNPSGHAKEPDLGPITMPEGIDSHVFADKELSSTDVSLMLVRPFEDKLDTKKTRAGRIRLALAHAIFDRRLERISKQENSPVASGSVSRDEWFRYAEFGSIDITAADDRWTEVVPVIEQEFRRAMEFGFTDAEIAEAKSNLLNSYEQAVKQKPTRKSNDIATSIVRSINGERVFSAPEANLEIAKVALAETDAKACHEEFRKFWEAPGYHLILTTKEPPEGAATELRALFEESRGKEVTAPAARASLSFAYENFGEPGTVKKTTVVEDLGITQLVLSNQVRVNLKQTSFEKNKIRISARIGSGQLSQPKDSPMLTMFATSILEGGGLGRHSNDELRQILAGRNVGTTFAIEEDALTLGGVTTPVDFALQCQLMCASITDPGYRTEALWQFQKAIPVLFQQLRHTAAGPAMEMQGWLHGGDSRYTPASETQLASYGIEDARKWLSPQLEQGHLELSIVGDFDRGKILPGLLATFGALSSRDREPPALPAARKVDFPNAPAVKIFTYDSKIPQGIATVLWKTDGLRGNMREARRLNILATILEDRMREEIREKLGASYSPAAGFDGSEALDHYSMLLAQSMGKPEDVGRLLETMRSEADQLASSGATADELDRALKPTLGILAKSLRDNGYWLGTVLDRSQTQPERLELARTRDKDYRSITLEEINALAKKYLGGQHALLVQIKPGE
ncbi:MAG: insulinase family protein [Verrucomicrobiota bacterium]